MMLNLYQHRPYHHQHHVEPADEEPWRISYQQKNALVGLLMPNRGSDDDGGDQRQLFLPCEQHHHGA